MDNEAFARLTKLLVVTLLLVTATPNYVMTSNNPISWQSRLNKKLPSKGFCQYHNVTRHIGHENSNVPVKIKEKLAVNYNLSTARRRKLWELVIRTLLVPRTGQHHNCNSQMQIWTTCDNYTIYEKSNNNSILPPPQKVQRSSES